MALTTEQILRALEDLNQASRAYLRHHEADQARAISGDELEAEAYLRSALQQAKTILRSGAYGELVDSILERCDSILFGDGDAQ
jgi:hypothetical protein